MLKMKPFVVVLFALLLLGFASYAQPRWSPEVRSQREIQWMQDSLHITAAQLNRINGISLSYQQDMDNAAAVPGKIKKQASLMRNKDAKMKTILNKKQYSRYFKREQLLRKQENIIYKGHQPL